MNFPDYQKPAGIDRLCDRIGLLDRIQNYLSNGGLFNPEMMEHDKARDLLMDCRDEKCRSHRGDPQAGTENL